MDLSGAFPEHCSHIMTSNGALIHHETGVIESAPAFFQPVVRRRRGEPEQDVQNVTDVNPLEEADNADDERDESDNDNENEVDIQEAILSDIVQEQNARRAQFCRRQTLLYWAIHLTTTVWNAVSWGAYYASKAAWGAYNGVQKETYYFFKDSPIPYSSTKVRTHRPGTPRLEWTYDLEARTFHHAGTEETEVKHFPYLTAQVNHEGLSLYDLTDFVQALHYCGATAPSAQHILAAWFLETGILLDTSLPMTLRVFTEEGEETNVPLRGL